MDPEPDDTVLAELVKSPRQQSYVLASVTGSTLNLAEVIDCEKYSSLN